MATHKTRRTLAALESLCPGPPGYAHWRAYASLRSSSRLMRRKRMEAKTFLGFLGFGYKNTLTEQTLLAMVVQRFDRYVHEGHVPEWAARTACEDFDL